MSQRDPVQMLAESLEEIIRRAVRDALADNGGAHDESALLSMKEGCNRLGLGLTTVKREIADGRLRSCVVGRRRLIPAAAIAEYAAALDAPDAPGGAHPPGEMEPA